jgi:hypothetical protein
MSGKEGKEGKVYSLIGGKGEYFGRAPLRFDHWEGEWSKHSPHSPFPHRRAATLSTDGSQRAGTTVVPALINGRITQHEAFAAQDELRYTRFTPHEPVGCH